MKEDVLRILKMIEEGKIDAESGSKLIEALGEKPNEEKVIMQRYKDESSYVNNEKMLYVLVDSHDGDKVKVNVPMNFVKNILSATGKLPIKAEGLESSIDMEIIKEAIMNDITGKIVDVETHDGDKVIVEIR
ncbi:hypothetical protein [Clostridium sp.]|uniref:SHOCT-like domain-containing protein n=1 Tax=Clostridium sp. TaxID=1506 RepID=UPI002FCC4127